MAQVNKQAIAAAFGRAASHTNSTPLYSNTARMRC